MPKKYPLPFLSLSKYFSHQFIFYFWATGIEYTSLCLKENIVQYYKVRDTFYNWELVISKMKYDNAVEKYLVHHFNVAFKKIYNKLQFSIKLRENKVIKEIHNFLRKISAIKTQEQKIFLSNTSHWTIKLHAGLVICILLHNCTVPYFLQFLFRPPKIEHC